MQPFKIVEREVFCKMILNFDPKYQLPTRNTIKNFIIKSFNKRRKNIKNYIKNISEKVVLENTPVEVEISRDQEDWFNSLEEELTQVQEDLNFYDNILGEFTAEDIVSL